MYGNLLGLLGAHPVAPLVSLHHLDVVDPIFPGLSRVEGLQRLLESVEKDSSSIIQQSFCYDKNKYWSISVSWGYVVQVMRGIISPRELEMPTRTFLNWYKRADYKGYAFNTRPVARHPCQKPFLFYLSSLSYDDKRRQIVGVYSRHNESHPYCRWKSDSPDKLNTVIVLKRSDGDRWLRVRIVILMVDQISFCGVDGLMFVIAVAEKGLLQGFAVEKGFGYVFMGGELQIR